MSNLMVINGSELTIKEYNGQRVVTSWDVAMLHGTNQTHIKNTFDRQKKRGRLKENEDYYMVGKGSEFVHTFCMNKHIDPRALNAVKQIPVFTESGYLMLTKSLDDDISWQVQRQLVNTYFAIRQVKAIVHNQLDANTALETSKFLVSLADAVGVSPEAKLLATKNVYRLAGIELPFEVTLNQKLYDLDVIAKRLGIFSSNGIPHAQAVSTIIKQLAVPDNIKVITFESKGSWQGSVTKFKEDIFPMVKRWLTENRYPNVIKGDKKTYKVAYEAIA